MENRYFEAEHINEVGMLKYIAMNNLSGGNLAFAKLIQKHLCLCEACRRKMILLEKLSEASDALGKHGREVSVKETFEKLSAGVAEIQASEMTRNTGATEKKKVGF